MDSALRAPRNDVAERLRMTTYSNVMRGPDPRIHQYGWSDFSQRMDCRVRPGNDAERDAAHRTTQQPLFRHSGMRPSRGAGPESILPALVMDSGLALRAPRNDAVGV